MKKSPNTVILILIVLGLTVLGYWAALRAAGPYGFTYPVDDAYIHLAIAQQLFESGSFCPQAGDFCMSSSSPGYSMLLALAGGWAGMPWWLPLVLNSIAAIGIVALLRASHFARKQVWREVFIFISVLILIPLPLLILNGMEHAWQLWANLWLCMLAMRSIQGEKTLVRMGLAAFVSVLFRYEGLFLAGAIAFIFLLKKRYREAFTLLLSSAASVVILGLYSLGRGGTFLPLTLLGKGQSPFDIGLLPWFQNGLQTLYENPFMLMLLLGLLFVIVVKKEGPQVFLAKVLALASLPQLWLAQVGGYRYEAWLIGLGLWLILPVAFEFLDKKPSFRWGLMAVFLLPFLIRASFFGLNHGSAVRDIAFQHRAMAAFFNEYYPGESVALNDIGAVCYETRCRVTDINGIADQPVILAKRNGSYSPDFIDNLSQKRNVKLAALHEQFVSDAIPKSWVKVGEWNLGNHFMTADPLLSWYAVDSLQAEKLEISLEDWQKNQPTRE